MVTWDQVPERSAGDASAAPQTLRRDRLTVILACLTLAAFSAPAMIFLGLSDKPDAPPTPLLRLYWPPVYALALVLCARRWRDLRSAWIAGLMIMAPAVWAWATRFWSLAPDDTSRRAVALLMTTLFGFALGAGFSGRTLVKIVAATVCALGVASAAVAIALPRYGVEQVVNVGCWRGLWDTKNALAAFMVIGAIASACALGFPGRRRVWLFAFSVCLLDLLMSRGKTSLVCLLLALALLAVYRLGRRGPVLAVLVAWAAGTALLVAGFVSQAAPGLFFKAIGKDPTLTGRTEIWTAVLDQVKQRPLGGFGFGAFWDKASVPAKVIARQTGWPAPEAHNGWLDLLAQVGWIGLVLTGGCCLAAVTGALARRRGRDDAMFAPVYVASFLALSFAESVLLSPNSLVWVVFVAAFTQLVGPLRAARSGRAAGA